MLPIWWNIYRSPYWRMFSASLFSLNEPTMFSARTSKLPSSWIWRKILKTFYDPIWILNDISTRIITFTFRHSISATSSWISDPLLIEPRHIFGHINSLSFSNQQSPENTACINFWLGLMMYLLFYNTPKRANCWMEKCNEGRARFNIALFAFHLDEVKKTCRNQYLWCTKISEHM